MQGDTRASQRTGISRVNHVPRRAVCLQGDTTAMQKKAPTMRGDTVIVRGDTIV